jgi:hypothetical protein
MKYWKYLFFASWFIQACNQTGHRVISENDKKNRVVRKYTVNERNQKDGEYREYYSDGTLKVLLNYSKDSLKGKQQSFYANGSLQSKGYYINGRLDSIQFYYFANKNLKSETFRLHGKLFGVQKEYEQNGKLKDFYFMMNDSAMATSLDFDQDGRITKKDGPIIVCIYGEKLISTMDSLKAVFYIVLPPRYDCDCKFVEKQGAEKFYQSTPCHLENINNNKAFLVTKQYKKPGKYQIGIFVNLNNQQLRSSISDSLFLPFEVR